MSGRSAVRVIEPSLDPDWDGTEFFESSEKATPPDVPVQLDGASEGDQAADDLQALITEIGPAIVDGTRSFLREHLKVKHIILTGDPTLNSALAAWMNSSPENWWMMKPPYYTRTIERETGLEFDTEDECKATFAKIADLLNALIKVHGKRKKLQSWDFLGEQVAPKKKVKAKKIIKEEKHEEHE